MRRFPQNGGALYADATNLYVLQDDPTQLLAFTKDCAAVTPPPPRPFAGFLGFDGSAFFVVREHFDPSNSNYWQEIDRDLVSGESTTLWTDGDLHLVAGGPMSLIPPDGQGGYVVGSRAPANGGPWRQPLLLQLDTAPKRRTRPSCAGRI